MGGRGLPDVTPRTSRGKEFDLSPLVLALVFPLLVNLLDRMSRDP